MMYMYIVYVIIKLLSNHSVYNEDNYLDAGNTYKLVEMKNCSDTNK